MPSSKTPESQVGAGKQPTVQKRIFELDVLRGVAILLVMGVHVPASGIHAAITSGYPFWTRSGWMGVDLFFVLSGFLISNLLFSEYRASGTIRLPRFFFRRALKLYPSFYLMLAVTLVGAAVLGAGFGTRQVMGELIMNQNYLGSIWDHTWSLAVEEHFYLLLPLALAVMMRARGSNPFRAIPCVAIAVAILCLGLRVWVVETHTVYDHRLSHLRFDSLFAGVLLGYAHNFRPDVLRRMMDAPWRFPIAMIGVLCLAPGVILGLDDARLYTVGLSLLYIGFGVLLLMALYPEQGRTRRTPGLAARAVASMGSYSYTIYLWNVPVSFLVTALAGAWPRVSPYLFHPLYFAATIGIGVLLSKLIERPVLRMRDRLWQFSEREWGHDNRWVPYRHRGSIL